MKYIPALILLWVLLLYGCGSGPTAAIQTTRMQPAQIPFQIKDKAVIGLVPILAPEPARKKDFYDYFLPPPNKDKYEQSSRYTAIMANRIKDILEQSGFIPFVANSARTEDLYAPEFFEVLKISCPSDYCLLIYLYELTNNEKKVGRVEPGKEGDYPVEQWQQDAIARSRIELYESADMNLIWQYNITANTLLITEKKISGSKALDDLAYSLIQPHYYEQINTEVALKTVQEMTEAFKSLAVNINLNNKVKTDIYLYRNKVSNDNLLKDITVTITDIALIKGNKSSRGNRWPKQDLTTDANGQISIELPEGFYRFEALIPDAIRNDLSSATKAGESMIHSLQTFIVGDVRRINIIIK